MATLVEARAQIAQRRKALQQARSNIPQVTATSLRTQGGLQGRERTRQIHSARDRVSQELQNLKTFEGGVDKAETAQKKAIRARELLIAKQVRRNDILRRHVKGKPLNRDEQFLLQKTFDETQGLEDSIRKIKARQDVSDIAPYLSSLPVAKLEKLRKFGVTFETIPAEVIEPAMSSSLSEQFEYSPVIQGPVQNINYQDVRDYSIPDRTGQIYSPDTKSYLTPTYGLGAGGTATYSQPTISELKIIDDASAWLGNQTKEVVTAYKVVGKYAIGKYKDKVVIPLSKTKIMEKWGENVVPLAKKYINDPVALGIGKTAAGISSLNKRGLTVRGKRVLAPLKETPGGRIVSDIAGTKKKIDTYNPNLELTYGYGRTAVTTTAGELQEGGLYEFGKTVYGGQVKAAWTAASIDAGVPAKEAGYVGTVAKGAADFGPYAVGGFYAAEVGIKVTEAAAGGKFGGPTNAFQYVKENPLEVAIVATMGIAKGANIWSGKAKHARELAKYKPYTDQAEKTKVILHSQAQQSSRGADILRPKLKVSQVGRGGYDPTKVAKLGVKGKVVVAKSVPSGSYSGKVVEKRLVKSDTFWGRVFDTKVEKTFKGTATLSKEGLFKQTISYTDDAGRTFTKVVTSPAKGKDVIQIFKGGKEVLKLKMVKVAPVKIDFKTKKVKKLKVDTGTLGDSGSKKLTRYDGKRKIVVEQAGKGKSLESTTRGVFDAKTTGKVGKSSKGYSTAEYTTRTTTTDIMSSGPRNIYAKASSAKGSVAGKLERAQKLKYGVEKPGDLAIYYRDKVGKLVLQKSSPITTRGLGYTQENILKFEYIKPTSKYGKEIAATAQAKSLALSKKVEKSKIIVEKKLLEKSDKSTKILKGYDPTKTTTTPLSTYPPSTYAYGGSNYQQTLTTFKEQGSQLTQKQLGALLQKEKLAGVTYFKPTSNYLSAAPKLDLTIGLKLSQSPELGLNLISKLGLLSILAPKTKLKEAAKQEAILKTDVVQEPDVKVDTRTTQSFAPSSSSSSSSQEGDSFQDSGGGDTTFRKPPKNPPLKTPNIIRSLDLPETGEVTKRRFPTSETKRKQGYHPEVKDKGKWLRVAKKPRTKKEALAIAGQIVDNSTAVQLRLIKSKQKAIKETISRRINLAKYRDYSIRAGKRTALPNQGLIELKRHRIDTLGEKQQLSAGKVMRGRALKSLRTAPRARKSSRKRNFLFGGGFGGKSQRLV